MSTLDFSTASPTEPRSPGTPAEKGRLMSIVIVGSQPHSSGARRTFLLGSISSHTQSEPAHVRIMHLE